MTIQIHVISRCVIKGLHCTRVYLFTMFDVCKKEIKEMAKLPFL